MILCGFYLVILKYWAKFAEKEQGMKRECLKITKFGPLKEVNIDDLKRINVFIGVSGSGKSIIMRTLAMCRWIYKMQCIRSYLNYSGIDDIPFSFEYKKILHDNGLNAYLQPQTEICYYNGSFSFAYANGIFEFQTQYVPQEELSLEKIAYISDKRILLPDLLNGNIAMKHGAFYLEETLLNFQKAMSVIPETEIPYLGVKLEVKDTNIGKRIIVNSNDAANSFNNLPLPSASSGLQSSVGLHLIIAYFSQYYNLIEAMNSTILSYLAANDSLSSFKAQTNVGDFYYKRISVFVEEPELSLFPDNQRGLINYMVGASNESKLTDFELIFATHSPYVLTALNVLMLAAKAYAKKPESVLDIIESGIMVGSSEVAAWEVKDGKVNGLIDADTGLINGSWLDSASDYFDEKIFRLNEIAYGE